jgi:two-component system chemotaxis response regulator CheY
MGTNTHRQTLADDTQSPKPKKFMKLLIVEDDERIRRLIKSVVSDLSDELYECSDGIDAEASYAKHLPDWVLMDLVMPEVDGITAIKLIKASHPEARIIIVTSYESAVMREEARQAGAFAYVLKENLLDLRNLLTDI